MKKWFLSRIAFLFTLSSASLFADEFAGELCITRTSHTSPDANATAVPAREGMIFASVNGHDIPFYTIAGTKPGSPGPLTDNTNRGCFPRKLLRPGKNHFAIPSTYAASPGLVIKGEVSFSFILQKGVPGETFLCPPIHYVTGDIDKGPPCEKDIQKSLSELDPEASAKIQEIQNRLEANKKHLKEISELQSAEELEKQLNAIAEKDLDQISLEELAKLGSDLAVITDKIKALKEGLDTARDHLKKTLGEFAAYLTDLKGKVVRELKEDGFDLEDPAFKRRTDTNISFSNTENSDASDAETPFDPNNNPYKQLADGTLARLDEAAKIGSGRDFNVWVDAWVTQSEVLIRLANARSGTLSVKEQEALQSSLQRVKEKIHFLSDDYGFLKESPVPVEIRKTVSEDSDAYSIPAAKKFRRELNKLKKSSMTEVQGDNLEFAAQMLSQTKSHEENIHQLKNEIYRTLISLYGSKDPALRINAQSILVLLNAADFAFDDKSNHEGKDLVAYAKAFSDIAEKKTRSIPISEFSRISNEIGQGKTASGQEVQTRYYIVKSLKRFLGIFNQKSASRFDIELAKFNQRFHGSSELWENPKLKSVANIQFNAEGIEALQQVESIVSSVKGIQWATVAAPLLSIFLTKAPLSGEALKGVGTLLLGKPVVESAVKRALPLLIRDFSELSGVHDLAVNLELVGVAKVVDDMTTTHVKRYFSNLNELCTEGLKGGDPHNYCSIASDIPKLGRLIRPICQDQQRAATIPANVRLFWKTLEEYFSE